MMVEWEKLKVVALKEECKARQIPLTGLKLKQQYVDKLIEYENNHSSEIKDAAQSEEIDQKREPDVEVAAEVTDDDAFDETNARQQDGCNENSPLEKKLHDTGEFDRPSKSLRNKANEADEAGEQIGGLRPEEEVVATHVDGPSQSDVFPLQDEEMRDATAEQDTSTLSATDQDPMPVGSPPHARNDLENQMSPVSIINGTTGENEERRHDVIEDRKRKRKNSTATLCQEEVVKKARGADGEVVPTKRCSHSPSLQSSSTSREESRENGNASGVDADTKSRATPHTEANDVVFAHSPGRSETQGDSANGNPPVQAAIHPATRSLYMRNFKRPISGPSLKAHVEAIVLGSSANINSDSAIDFFYMDKIKSHAFFTFSSISAASRVRSFMHQSRFPDEPMREPLWVDFVPDDMVQGWADQETGSGSYAMGRNSAVRYEVVYDQVNKTVIARLQELDVSGHPQGRPALGATTNGAPNPGDRMAPFSTNATRSSATAAGMHLDRAALVAQSPLNQRQRSSVSPSSRKQHVDKATGFKALEELFEVTTTKPKLYYKLPPQNIIDDRLDMIRDLYPDRGFSGDPGMKRYTFDRRQGRQLWIDNGPEFGHGRRGQEILAGGGRGRGRGGYRGRGAARSHGGDSYRGGGWAGR